MRINLICLILLSTLPILRGQNFDLNLEGTSWVKTKVTLASGKEVPIDDELRYSYLKYTFNKNTMLVSNDFREKGSKMAALGGFQTYFQSTRILPFDRQVHQWN